MAIRIQVNLADSTVGPVAAAPPASGRETRANAILGGNEVAVTATNLTRVQIPNNRVRVSFDVALTNRLTSSSLVPPTFPAGAAGATGLLLFPYRVTQVAGGSAPQVVASLDWNGDGAPGSGAPRNFFNDFGCPVSGPRSDCLRWEQFPAPLYPGETTPAQRIGFDLPRRITSFEVLMVLAADVSSDLPAPARLEVTPSSYVMNDGFPATFTATAYDIGNNPLPWVTVRWTAADPTALQFQYGGALVNTIAGPSVVAHGRKLGLTSFTARTGGLVVTVPVDIQVNTVALVQLYVAPDSVLDVGEQVQGDVRIKDHSGQIIPGFQATWSTSDPNVATVDQTGLIRAVGPGMVTITATAGATFGTVPLTVQATTGNLTGFVVTGGTIATPPGILTLDISGVGWHLQTTTDAFGEYQLTGIPAGDLTLEVLNPPAGCTSPVVRATVPRGGTVDLVVQLSCTGGLTFRFLDGGVFPVPGMRLEVNAHLGFETDAHGELVLLNQAPAQIEVLVLTAPIGCVLPAPVFATPSPGGMNIVVVQVACPGPATLVGRVTVRGLSQFDGSPVPLPGSTITVARLANAWQTFLGTQSGADGSYRLDPAPIGDIELDARHPTGCAEGFVQNILGRSTTTIDFAMRFCPLHTVDVQIVDLSPSPFPIVQFDIRVEGQTGNATYGGAIGTLAVPHLFTILGDGAAYRAYVVNLPAGCSATSASDIATPGGTTTAGLFLRCQ
jgi:hypothetical protein